MSVRVKCITCGGTGKVIGLGYIREECHICDGKGRYVLAPLSPTVKNLSGSEVPVIVKKRGRKKAVDTAVETMVAA